MLEDFKERTMDYWDRVKAYAWSLKGDGCSGAPDFNYRKCCDRHDIHYRTGKRMDGTPILRSDADKLFLACMKGSGRIPIVGTLLLPYLYYGFVRVFGQKAYFKNKDETSPRND